jgi:FkbM family methyltransferase
MTTAAQHAGEFAKFAYVRPDGTRDIIYRPGTSDINVVNQIFTTRDYELSKLRRADELREARFVLGDGRAPLIVDCGANIGASSVFFHYTIPGSRVVAIEPEASNFELLRLNASGLGIECVRGAIASEAGQAIVTDPSSRGNKASFRTEVLPNGTAAGDVVPCLTVNDLYTTFAAECFPYIVKIDIEGAEAELFSAHTEWLDATPLVIIELHDWLLTRQSVSRNFLRCIANLDRDFVHIGENIFSIKNDLMPSPPDVPPFWS